ncbi:acetyl-CoA sensor PanZ family protein [Spongiibacter sp. KMU-158]|uniref:Acetyl-CoA sensor PanZ family protein n=1 Tax=Spongiibacter pelagi TaxID=2760804 RepID=A0A927C2A3_9GAMM|nr:acetyl-CoA sensor PanZ family protein [Spongiibacter pelagi]MBD2859963.1 acetyl-CoA sensor PanZ family protein [Spongiibacter pelagi]
MPVYAEFIKSVDEPDRADLERLYGKDTDKLLNAAEKDKLILVAGRFNGKLIAGFTLTPIHAGDYQMARLCVREITRRRGVARQLLIQAFKALPEELVSISADLRSAPELCNLMSDLGFKSNGAIWQWQHPQKTA